MTNFVYAKYGTDSELLLDPDKVTTGPGVPSNFTSRSLNSADDGANLICATAKVATVNADLPTGFGCAFKGTVSFSGTASVTDLRTTGSSNPWCALVQTATNTYDVLGTKA